MKCDICGCEIKQGEESVRDLMIDWHVECPSPWPRLRELEKQVQRLEAAVRHNAGFYVDDPEIIIHRPSDQVTG